jgi:hypothetical protein
MIERNKSETHRFRQDVTVSGFTGAEFEFSDVSL